MAFENQLDQLVLPHGALTGQPRIVLDGTTGRITVYNSSDQHQIIIDPEGDTPFGNQALIKWLVNGIQIGRISASSLGMFETVGHETPNVSALDGQDVYVSEIWTQDNSQYRVGYQVVDTSTRHGGDLLIQEALSQIAVYDNDTTMSEVRCAGTSIDFTSNEIRYNNVPMQAAVNGQTLVTIVAATNFTITNIPYGVTFNTVPVVHANLSSVAGVTLNWIVNTYGATTSTFNLRGSRAAGAAVSWTNVPVDWTAIGR